MVSLFSCDVSLKTYGYFLVTSNPIKSYESSRVKTAVPDTEVVAILFIFLFFSKAKCA